MVNVKLNILFVNGKFMWPILNCFEMCAIYEYTTDSEVTLYIISGRRNYEDHTCIF